MAKKLLPPIHLLCSGDEFRPSTNYVEILDGIATATNGYLIGRLNLNEYGNVDENVIQKLSGKLIHKDVWEMIQDAEEIMVSEEMDNQILYYKGGVEAKVSIRNPDNELKFPDYDSIIRKVANSKFDKKSFISFNPEWIVIAKKLFGKETLIIRFFEQEQMFLVFPGTEAKGFIGIMPMQLTEEDAVLDFSLS